MKINKVILIGNWTRDCDLKFTPGNGTPVLAGTLAVQKRFRKEGEQQADFIPIVIWGKQAESTANYCGLKGNKVSIVGRIQTRSYDKDGEKRYVTEVIADEVEFLGSKKTGQTSSESWTTDYSGQGFTPDDSAEDIPFN